MAQQRFKVRYLRCHISKATHRCTNKSSKSRLSGRFDRCRTNIVPTVLQQLLGFSYTPLSTICYVAVSFRTL